MLIVSDIKIPIDKMTITFMTRAAARIMKVSPSELRTVRLAKKSVDARKKDDVHFVCSAECELNNPAAENRILSRGLRNVSVSSPYVFSVSRTTPGR